MCRKVIYLSFVLAMVLVGPGQRDAVADPNFVLWYKLDEGGGLAAQDSSGYNHHGIIETWPEELPVNWGSEGGHSGGYLIFNDDTRIKVPKSTLDKVSDGITVSLWLKDAWRVGQNWTFDAAVGWEEPFRITAAIGTAPDAEVLWQAGGDVNDAVRWDAGNVQALDGWHFWTFVKDEVADNITIYLDGLPAVSKSAVDDTLRDVLPTELAKAEFVFHIGASSSHWNHLKARVDEFVIYDRALSNDEVLRMYYTAGDINLEVSWKPDPVDGTGDLCDDVVLSWNSGDSATQHDVYFGTDHDNVENASTVSAEYRLRQGPNSYDAGALETLNPGVRYYWRIDEVSGVVTKGDVWEFTINDGSAFGPDPADGEEAVLIDAILSWSAGCWAAEHDVYFGTDYDAVKDATTASSEYMSTLNLGLTSWVPPSQFDYLTDYYWRIDEVNGPTTWKGQVWSFKSQTLIIDPNNTLWYKLDETEGYVVHDSSNYLNHGVIDMPGEEDPPAWDPMDGQWGGSLGFNDDGGIWVPTATLSRITDGVGIIFWAKQPSRPILNANGGDSQLMINFEQTQVTWRAGNDTDDVVTYDLGTGGMPEDWHWWAFIKDENADSISIYYDGELAEAKSVVADTLTGVRDKPFKIGAETAIDGDFDGRIDDLIVYDRALSTNELVRQYYSGGPVGKLGQAWMPYPRDGDAEVPREVVLAWKPGDYTDTRDVYLGTAWDDVNDADTTTAGIFRGNWEPNNYDPPGELEFDTTYYWRVDEINEPNIWKGRIWSFTTANFLVVDDMESYSSVPFSGNEIFDTWADGFQNWTGAQIALEYGPGATVHRGTQSMKMGYNNAIALLKFSEADANTTGPIPGNLTIGKDWTVHDVKSMGLFFYGQAGNDSTEQLYVALEDTPGDIAVVNYGVYGEDMSDVTEPEWHEFNIDLEDFNQAGVDIKDVNKVRIGFGDREHPVVGGSGEVFFDDIRLYRLRCVPWLVKPASDLSDNCIVDWADIVIMAEHWLRTDFVLDTDNPGTTALVGHWELDGDAMDSSSYANHGTITGDYTWVPDHNDGLALAFTAGICKVPDAAHLRPPSTVSASAWVKYSGSPGDSPRVVVKGADNWESYCIEMAGENSVTFYVGDTNGTRYFADSEEDDVAQDEWVHLAGTYDGSLVKCYVNGQVVGDNNEAVAIPLSQDTSDLGIGNRPDDEQRQFRGTIDEVRVYNRALSATEVAWLATDGTGYVPLRSRANLYDEEPQSEKVVNLKDFALLGSSWLEKTYWP